MTFIKSTAAALATATILDTPAAQAQNNAPPTDILQLLQRISGQYLVMITRTFVDLTYDTIQVEPKTNNLIVSGLRLYPELDWDQNAECVVEIDRALMGGIQGFDLVQSVIEFSGVTLSPSCLPPDAGGMLAAFGYQVLTADTMTIDIAYELPTAAADVTVQAAIREVGDVTLSAAFDYLWFRIPTDGGDDPIPVAILESAELAIENGGVWERVEPMVLGQIGDPAAVPPMIQAMLGQMFTEGGTRAPSENETAFVANVASEVERFLRDKNRIVVTAAPQDGLYLDEDLFSSPSAALEALQPELSATPLALRSMIDTETLSAALAGGSVPEDQRLRVGEALVSGIGAPLAPREGQALLMPLADAWNGPAAAALAASFQETDVARSYDMSLRALAGGDRTIAGVADQLEARMSLADVLAAQQRAISTWPGNADYKDGSKTILESGDVSAMRRLASVALTGQNMPRDYAAAYFWASLAAAAGDRGGVSLRERLDYRFAGNAAWQQTSGEVASEVLKAWTTGGVAAAVTRRMQ